MYVQLPCQTNDNQDNVRKPIDAITSTTARRAYLTTFLLLATALVLLGFAITAYTLFYWSYIPRIGFERTIHLQFDNVYRSDDSRYDGAGSPYGTVYLSPDVVSAQRYDVFVELSLPRTLENQEAGNFMIEATMYASESAVDPLKEALVPGAADADNQLARSRRPAILLYRSQIVDQLYKFTQLHWYLLGWKSETDSLKVSMFESVEFSRGWRNVPASMLVQIQSINRMQVYSAKAIFRARFRGLRWLMYNHRIISAFVFISAFWITEMMFTGLAWAIGTGYLTPSEEVEAPGVHNGNEDRIKSEDEDDYKAELSDTERTFPTSSKQQPLRYQSPPIKQEEDEEPVVLPEHASRATEADDEDEDEDADVFIDSGIGTSLESSATRRDSVRKRRGRTGSGDGGK